MGEPDTIEELMQYPMSHVPCSIATADLFLARTDKSKGFHYIVKELDDAPNISVDGSTILVQDGNALFSFNDKHTSQLQAHCRQYLWCDAPR